MITTSSTITINKVLRLGPVTTYTANAVSLFIKVNDVQKRYDASSVVNSTGTSSGLVTFTNIPLAVDGNYSFYITAENNNDLDVSGVSLDKLATGFIKKISSVNVLTV
jgi:hypothetical protein